MIRTIGLFFLLLFKILGCTLLILLAFFLLFLLFVLFVPIRYQFQVQNERSMDSEQHHPTENLLVQLKVNWLLHLVQVSVSYGPHGFSNRIRAAGIDIQKVTAWFKKKKERKQESRQTKKSTPPDFSEQLSESGTQQAAAYAEQLSQEVVSSKSKQEPQKQTSAESQLQACEITAQTEPDQPSAFTETDEPQPDQPSAFTETDQSQPDQPSAFTEAEIHSRETNADEDIRSVSKDHKRRKKKKIKTKQVWKKKKVSAPGQTAKPSREKTGLFTRIRSQYARIRKEIEDEANRYAVGRIWSELLKVIRCYRPKKLKADVSFSLADPALTGQAVGLISLIPLVYRYPCSIIPDFTSEQMYFEGSIMAQGKVSIYVFALTTLRLLCDKKFMRVIRRLTKRKH